MCTSSGRSTYFLHPTMRQKDKHHRLLPSELAQKTPDTKLGATNRNLLSGPTGLFTSRLVNHAAVDMYIESAWLFVAKGLGWSYLLRLLRAGRSGNPASRAREGLGTPSLWSGHLLPCLWRRTRKVSRSGGGAAVSATLSGPRGYTPQVSSRQARTPTC